MTSFASHLDDAVKAHLSWKQWLKQAIDTGRSTLDAHRAADDTCCVFGQWLHGDEIGEPTRAGKPWQVVSRLHHEFHQSAARTLRLATEGDADAARAVFEGEYAERSDKLLRALQKWRSEL